MQGVRIAQKSGTKKNGARKDAVSGSKVVVVYYFDVLRLSAIRTGLRSVVRLFVQSSPFEIVDAPGARTVPTLAPPRMGLL